MKHRISAFALALLLLMCAVPAAHAAEEPLVAPVRSYSGQFSDVAEDAWYYDAVASLYALGLTNGQEDGSRFAPEDEITVAEALTMAARLRSLYEYGDAEAGPAMYGGSPWYAPYVAYLQSRRAIAREFDDLFAQSATRAQTAHILANALPQTLFTDINGDAVAVGYASHRYIRDVNDYTPYRQDILTLYRWGILSGMDRTGSFLPDERIQRSQVAAMVTRLADSKLRIRLDWDVSLNNSRAGTTLKSLVDSDGTFHAAPDWNDLQQVDDNIRTMLAQGQRRMTLRYPPNTLTADAVNAIQRVFLDVMRHYVEQTYNQIQAAYSAKTGSLVLTFSSSLYSERMIDSYREATMEAAVKIHDQLWADGTITSSMTEYEKARAYFTWLCQHCTYDFSSDDQSMSHSGYGALVEELAVCDGYTAAYNLLLKLEGIQCTTWSTDSHIWTVATLDGTAYHIDPTWGDQAKKIDYRFFGMTEAVSLARFASGR